MKVCCIFLDESHLTDLKLRLSLYIRVPEMKPTTYLCTYKVFDLTEKLPEINIAQHFWKTQIEYLESINVIKRCNPNGLLYGVHLPPISCDMLDEDLLTHFNAKIRRLVGTYLTTGVNESFFPEGTI